ncbi:MAG TPA: virion morphogenesis protein, partial [Acinetobacter radioresistens]|nr:virion morphogenesis protein [Acinetobacter radioresistens]
MAFAITIRPDNESAVMAVLQHMADFDSRKEDMFV